MNKGIFQRIVKPYFILVTIILSAAFFFVYRAQVEKAKGESYAAAEQIAAQTASFLDSYIESMDVLAEQVKHRDAITKYFYYSKENPTEGNIFDANVVKSIDMSSELKNLLVGRNAGYTVFIFNDYGDFVSSSNYMIDREAAVNLLNSGVYQRELARIKAAGGTLVIQQQRDRWSKSTQEYITLAKELKNDFAEEEAGIIEVRAVLPTSDMGIENDSGIIIRNRANNTTVYPLGESPKSGHSYISVQLEKSDWEVMLDYGESIKNVLDDKTLIIFVLMYIMLIAAMLVLTSLIGKRVSKPILQLSDNVSKIAIPGEKLIQVKGGTNEIEKLEESFSQMLARLSEASEREKKAYALALQAQMNPHFLCNSLAVIGAQGLDEGSERVYGMCAELSDMLRYVAAYESVTVKLSEECTHTRNYLSLMKARYEEYFDYTMEIDDELLDMRVPKLFIQPLAENCFMHGFKKTEPPWRIDISMHGSQSAWELRIKDNGIGISREKAAEILKKADESCEHMTTGSIGGLGMINTIVRLRITHNSNTRCIINGENGTEIIIRTGEKNDV